MPQWFCLDVFGRLRDTQAFDLTGKIGLCLDASKLLFTTRRLPRGESAKIYIGNQWVTPTFTGRFRLAGYAGLPAKLFVTTHPARIDVSRGNIQTKSIEALRQMTGNLMEINNFACLEARLEAHKSFEALRQLVPALSITMP